MRTKHVLIDFEDVYVKPNVWQQLGLNGRSTGAVLRAAMLRSLADQPDGPPAGSIPN